MRTTRWIGAAAVLALLAGAAPVHAATAEVKYSGTVVVPPEPKGGNPGGPLPVYTLYYKAAAGEANDLRAAPATTGGGVRLTDGGAAISPGAGCQADGAGVVCTGISGGHQYELGDGNDFAVFVGSAGGMVDAGEGSDSVRFADASGTARLGPGDDTAIGDYSAPLSFLALRVDGGPGADTIDATIPRMASVTYADRTNPVSVSLDGAAGDGEAGEGDNIGSGVGSVTGGAAGDTLTGGDDTDDLTGGPGNDVLSGRGDKDILRGGEGDDTLQGDDGDELFVAEPGADVYSGGAGFDQVEYIRRDDTRPLAVTIDDQPGDGAAGENDDVRTDVEGLIGGLGDDRLTGSDGPDAITANVGSDVVDGRGGDDSLFANDANALEGGGLTKLIGGSGSDRFQDVNLLTDVIAVDGEADAVECSDRGIAAIMGDLSDTGKGCLFGLDVPSRRSRVEVDRRGFLRLPAACVDIGVVCAGKIALVAPNAATRRAAGSVLARGSLKVENRKPRRVRLRLSSRARKALAKRGSLTVSARFATTRTLPAESRTRSETVKLVAAGR